MTATRQEPNQRSVGELFGQLAQDASLLIRQEIALARVELTQKADRLRRDTMAVAAGVAVLYFGAFALLAGLILFLDQVVGLASWLAALLVGAVLAIAGYLMLQRSLRELRRINLVPRHTVETLKDDMQWVKEQQL